MSESKKPKQSSGRSAAAKKKQQNQTKQLIVMAVILVICAVLITWTVMLMRERLAETGTLNEQLSSVDIMEMSSAEDPAEGTQTSVSESAERTVTSATETTSETGTTDTTRMSDATAPPSVVVQDPHFVAKSTTKPKQTAEAQQTGSGTTHTEPQGIPSNAPSGSEVGYNQLLSLYLGAQHQGGSAYFADAYGEAEATVVLHDTGAYYVISAADGFSTYNWLGGTGNADEHPWQTDAAFRIYQYDDDSRYLYYSSQGNNYEVIGYFDPATCENVWARLHYYQLGVGWQAEYHISHYQRPDSLNGTQTELYSGTFDTDTLYTISEDFMQTLVSELQNRGISVGSWSDYTELSANQQADAIRRKAGSFNSSFAPKAGESYGVVASGSGSVTLRETAAASGTALAYLPDGAFVSIPTTSLPLGNGAVAVSALVNGTWLTGYLNGADILSWKEQ